MKIQMMEDGFSSKPSRILALFNNKGTFRSTDVIKGHDVYFFFNDTLEDGLSKLIEANTYGKTVLDITEDLFDGPHGTPLEMMAEEATIVTCHNSIMQERIYECTGVLAKIIPTAYTGELAQPCLNEIPKIIWRNDSKDLFSLRRVLKEDLTDFPVTILTEHPFDSRNTLHSVFRDQKDVFERMSGKYDIFLLPTAKNNKYRDIEDAVEAISLGLLVVTNDRETYQELEDFIVIVDDFTDALNMYITIPEEMELKVEQGQRYIKDHYSEEVLSKKWKKALGV